MKRAEKIKSGQYMYKGYRLICHGYYPPDKRVVWEAVNVTGDADAHAYTKRLLMKIIDGFEQERER